MFSVWILRSIVIMTTLAFTSEVRDEHVLATTTTQSGVEVTVVSKLGQKQQGFTFENYSLSSGCGQHFRRCQNVLVKRYPPLKQYIVFLPLENAIGILDFRYHDGDELLLSAHHVTPLRCSPVGVFDILRSIYVVCLRDSDLVVYEIILNQTRIMTTSPRFVTSIPLYNVSNQLSNVVFISLGDFSDQKHLFFTDGNYVYEITPHEYRIRLIGTLTASAMACTIAYAGDNTLIAYCQHEVVYFDLILEKWVNRTTYAERGKPIICPNPDIHLAVYLEPVSNVLYGLWSQNTIQNFSIHGFDSGVCFGNQNKIFFAYNDREDGVYIMELFTFRLTQLSPKACMNQCDPLLVFDNRYLVIRRHDQNGTTIKVVDSTLLDFDTDPSIVEAQHTSADLIALIPDLEPTISSTTPSTTTTTTTTTTTNTTTAPTTIAGNSKMVASGRIGSFAIIAAAVVASLSSASIAAVICYCWKRHRTVTARYNMRPASDPLRRNSTHSSDQLLDNGMTRSQQVFPGVGGNIADAGGISSVQERERGDSESDIDYPVDSSDCQSAEFRRDIEGRSAHDLPGSSTSTSPSGSLNNPVEDRNSPSEITTPTSLRREGYMPEGSSDDNLDVTTQTVACTESNPILWSVDDGILSARNDTHSIASHPDVVRSNSYLESVGETHESSQSASATTSPNLEEHIS